ncbi:MAG: hypothetical protein K0R82_1477 [Flavipsychrobacter sp.]|jgi:hypothetical protein|nr:hypothetical protein [Flavipsychrobacter sp.]
MKWFLISILSLFGFVAHAQDIYLLPNEEVIYSFETTNGKKVMVARETQNAYLVYRFGSKHKLEFEYPTKDRNSWKKFSYSFLLRGGGIKNEGMDLNYLYFDNNGFRYVIYQTYYARGEERFAGVKVINLEEEGSVDVKAKYSTVEGSLGGFFRGEKLVRDGEELFE